MAKKYTDGFVLVVPKRNLAAYKKIAQKACVIWMEHGAIEYCECVGDDLKTNMGVSFPKLTKTKSNETVVFAWVSYKSRKHRDAVNKKVMADPRLQNLISQMPFDAKRMSYGGFDVLVSS